MEEVQLSEVGAACGGAARRAVRLRAAPAARAVPFGGQGARPGAV
eukprot:gene9536-47614_t